MATVSGDEGYKLVPAFCCVTTGLELIVDSHCESHLESYILDCTSAYELDTGRWGGVSFTTKPAVRPLSHTGRS